MSAIILVGLGELMVIFGESKGQSFHALRPSRLCAQAQSIDDMPFRFQLPICLRVISGSQTVSDTLLKHDLCELVIAEVRTVITNDGTGGSKPSKERFQEFANNSGVIGGERFHFDPFRQVIDSYEWNFEAFHLVVKSFLTLTSVTRFKQVVGISIDCEPIKSRVKHLLGGVVHAMMSPGGSIMASLENVNVFLAVNTPPDDLIRTDLEQEGVVPKVMLYIFKEFVLLLG
nr:hypothetical protein [Tanacetum cinerariifolium]